MFINVLTQVAILLILILIGVIMSKTKILSDKAVKGITDMVLYYVTPCVIIK
ncbi:MAG: AEC family transporter, partial [Acutalibacteraceae bacterium]